MLVGVPDDLVAVLQGNSIAYERAGKGSGGEGRGGEGQGGECKGRTGEEMKGN